MTMRERYQIAVDEGTVYRTYLDPLHYPTGGVGHLMSDEEVKKYPVGTEIPIEVVQRWLDEDMLEAVEAADRLLENCPYFSEELHDIITNMAFNLGERGLRGFKRMWEAINRGLFSYAAEEMKHSRWYIQVGHRSKRLYERMKNLQGVAVYVGKSNTPTGESTGESSPRSEGGC